MWSLAFALLLCALLHDSAGVVERSALLFWALSCDPVGFWQNSSADPLRGALDLVLHKVLELRPARNMSHLGHARVYPRNRMPDISILKPARVEQRGGGAAVSAGRTTVGRLMSSSTPSRQLGSSGTPMIASTPSAHHLRDPTMRQTSRTCRTIPRTDADGPTRRGGAPGKTHPAGEEGVPDRLKRPAGARCPPMFLAHGTGLTEPNGALGAVRNAGKRCECSHRVPPDP